MKSSGNTILITGGSTGIGFSLAKDLVKKGNQVIVTGRNASKLQKAKEEVPELHTVQGDLSRREDIEALATEIETSFKDLNVLINNAGTMQVLDLREGGTPTSLLTKEIELNLNGPILLTDRLMPLLRKQDAATVVNVSSALAFVPLPASPVYCATKAALHSYTQSLREQMRGTNVSVVEVAPPAVETPLTAGFEAEGFKKMDVEDHTRFVVQHLERGTEEIRPGPSNQLRFMSRFFPNFILGQMTKPLVKMLTEMKAQAV